MVTVLKKPIDELRLTKCPQVKTPASAQTATLSTVAAATTAVVAVKCTTAMVNHLSPHLLATAMDAASRKTTEAVIMEMEESKEKEVTLNTTLTSRTMHRAATAQDLGTTPPIPAARIVPWTEPMAS